MADQLTDVLVAGYPDVERATKEFDDLVAAVKAKSVRIEGAILITHDKDDNVVVQQTGDHLGRKGLGYGGSVGFLVGLAAPPLLAATVIGAAAGGIAGRFAKHKMETGLHDKIGEALKPGTAAILAMFEEDQALAVQQVLGGALARSVVQTEKSGTAALKDSLAEAMGKFSQDRTVLPIPDRTFGGVAGRTMDTSVGDWSMIPGPEGARRRPERPARAHRRRGLRRPGHVRRRDPDAEPDARPAGGPDLQPLPRHRGLLADARRHAHRTQPPPRGHGWRRRVPRPVPGLHGDAAAQLHGPAQDPQGERLHHRRLRQVAHDARARDGSRGAVRALAAGLGLRPLVGVPDRVPPASTTRSSPRTTRSSACRRARTGSCTTSPTTSRTSRSSGCTRSVPMTPPSRGSCTTRPARRTRRTTSPASGRTSTRASSTTAGTRTASGRSRARRSSASSRRRPSWRRAPDPYPAWDTLGDAEKKPVRPPDGGVRRLLGEHRLERRPPASTRSRRWASSTTPSSSTSGATTARPWRAPSPGPSTRPRSSTAWS